MSTIRPRRSRIIPFAARRTQRKAPVRLVSMTRVPLLVAHPHEQLVLVMPALATSTSTGPCVCLDLGERGVDGRGVGDVAAHARAAPRAARRSGR